MTFKRKRYKFGCLQLKLRKHGPDVWVLRYREPQPDRTPKLASHMIGTIEQYHTASQAWKAAEAFRLSINPDNPAQHGVTWRAVIDHYIATELPPRTARAYLHLLNNYIKPRWGDYPFLKVKPFAVQKWLDGLKRKDESEDLALKTKKHIRALMHLLYGCAMRWEFVPKVENPFGKRSILIRTGQPPKKRRSLPLDQFHKLLRHKLIRAEPIRTMVIIAICLGLRRSELFALRWSDFHWDRGVVNIERRIVRGEIDNTKTLASEAELPVAAELAEVIMNWKLQSAFTAPEDFVFASPTKGGKAPLCPGSIQAHYLRPAGIDIGFVDSFGWHTLRHTYRTQLDEVGAPLSVQQALMRHADPHMTLAYGEAVTSTEREANSAVVRRFLNGGASF